MKYQLVTCVMMILNAIQKMLPWNVTMHTMGTNIITMESVGTSVEEVKGYFQTWEFVNVNGKMTVTGMNPAMKITGVECK